jgi:probable rRNA maturation factor
MKVIKPNTVNIRMKKKASVGFDIEAAVLAVLDGEKKQGLEINVVLVDNAYIKAVNLEYRLKNAVTDVISFEAAGGGDIFISVDRAKEQALEYGAPFKEEISRLLVHGTLHVTGYDHMNARDEKKMKPKERKYMRIISKENGWTL